MRCEKEPDVGLPELSRAGVNLARLVRIRQVVESSVLDPLDEVTLHPDTRPFGPMVKETETVPCSSRSNALDG